MGSDDIVVGKKPQVQSLRASTAENTGEFTAAPSDAAGAKLEQHCGAMSQQRGDSSAVSTPQKFVRLIGWREPKSQSKGPKARS